MRSHPAGGRAPAPTGDGSYQDIAAAIVFLERAFGFREIPTTRRVSPAGVVGHSEHVLESLVSLELPRREAADMDVELVEPAAAVLLELNLEFVLSLRNGQTADAAGGADSWTSPRAGRCGSGELSLLDGRTG